MQKLLRSKKNKKGESESSCLISLVNLNSNIGYPFSNIEQNVEFNQPFMNFHCYPRSPNLGIINFLRVDFKNISFFLCF